MFTGIITDIGSIAQIESRAEDCYLRIQTHYDTETIVIGSSISCNGICLSVMHTDANSFSVMASAETAQVTTLAQWQTGTRINLERALRLGDELGGHLVSGHVDGVALLLDIQAVGDSHRLTLAAPDALQYYIARKGSVSLDGISLTVNQVEGAEFIVNIIPHSWAHTNLADRRVGDALNLEIDLFARYMERLEQRQSA